MHRRSILSLLVAIILNACAPSFSAVNPTIFKLRDLGYSCGDGIKDNVPSGLYQWHCDRSPDRSDLTELVDGNDRGVAEIDLAFPSNDPDAAKKTYESVIADVPPLVSAKGLHGVLDSWFGEQTSEDVQGIRVAAECQDSWCTIWITSTTSPLDPIPVP